MAERKAVNKYYPPDWDPASGSINKHNNSHSLRSRAKKIAEGILVVRFEMPFNIWCLGCDNHIAMGVRYNAEKRKVGNYYTSPIYQFKMKCRLCETHFIIQTDPGKFDYVILSGARRQALQTSQIEAEDQVEGPQLGNDEPKRRMNDAMSRLEKRLEDKIKSEAQLPTLVDLKEWRLRWKDNFSANQLVRAQFRKKRKQIEHREESDNKLLKKASLDIPLVTPQTSDTREAKEMLLRSRKAKNVKLAKSSDILNTTLFVAKRPQLIHNAIKIDDKA